MNTEKSKLFYKGKIVAKGLNQKTNQVAYQQINLER